MQTHNEEIKSQRNILQKLKQLKFENADELNKYLDKFEEEWTLILKQLGYIIIS